MISGHPFRILLIPLAVGGIAFVAWQALRPDMLSAMSCSDRETPPRIIAFGDSLVVGYGADTPGGFVSMVSSDIGVPIENLGRNGDTSTSARERLSVAVGRNPDIAIVLLGGNDALRRVSPAVVEQNLEAIVTALTDQGTQVLVLGVTGGLPFNDPYPAIFERLDDMPGVHYVTNVLSGIFGRQELMSDQIHPNEAGYRRIADRVTPAVQDLCGELSTDTAE